MMRILLLSVVFVSSLSTLSHGTLLVQPEQVHLSLGRTASEMMITWTTFDPTVTSVVEYGLVHPEHPSPHRLTMSTSGTSSLFMDGGNEQRVIYIHRVLLSGLQPGKAYLYHVGSPADGWSPLFTFTTIKDGTNWSPRLAVFGDLGNVNGQSIPRLQEEVQNGNFDAVLHVVGKKEKKLSLEREELEANAVSILPSIGREPTTACDIAYNMDTDNARVGDAFMRQIEPIAAYLPYQTVVGNHEQKYNFSNYVNRFSMVDQRSGQVNNLFYSFNIGPAHIIGISTEFYFFIEYGWHQINNQFKWLEQDLIEANKPENRKERPWIITMGHRPMYCSTDDRDDCRFKESIVRKGIPLIHAFGLEDLFYKYGVDIEFWAHEHVYERMWPVYDRKVKNGSMDEPYKNPGAPIHIVTGSAGCQERIDPFVPNPPEWSAIRISDYGWTRMNIWNGTHITMEQISDDQDGSVVDSFTIVKESHGSYE